MKKHFLTLILAVASTFIFAQNQSLTLTFTNIEKAKGNIMIALKTADSSHVDGAIVPVEKMENVSYTFKDLKPGKYAVQVFHDVNGDEKLNTNMVGMPTEPYGFSNNARGTFGPPSLDEMLFSFPEKKEMTIKLE